MPDLPAPSLAALDAQLRSEPKPLWLVSAAATAPPAERAGLLAVQVWPASIDPQKPQFLVGLAAVHHTRSVIARTGRLLLQRLDRSQARAALPLGLSSGHAGDKWANLPHAVTPSGLPYLEPCAVRLELTVASVLAAGGRDFLLCDVTSVYLADDLAGFVPLTDADLIRAAVPAERKRLKEMFEHDVLVQRAV